MELIGDLDLEKPIRVSKEFVIQGLRYIDKITHSDDRGHLIEIHRNDSMAQWDGEIGQVYHVHTERQDVIRGLHRHDKTWYCFYVVNGSAKFNLVDARKNSETHGMRNEYIVSAMNKKLLMVPPGIYNGWISLTPNVDLIGVTSLPYNRKEPDDVKAPPNSFGIEWEVKGR